MHTLLIGLDFHPEIRTGDKSFWLDALPFLAERHDRISVISSVRGFDRKVTETVQLGRCAVHSVYLPPVRMVQAGSKRRNVMQRFQHVVGKAISSNRLATEAKHLIRGCRRTGTPVTTVHLMDNLGPWMSSAMARLSIPTCISAVSLTGDVSGLYKQYLKYSYGSGDIHIVPCSIALGEWIASLGIARSRLHTIKWGVNIPVEPVSNEMRTRSKAALGIPADHTLILWSGYIQQVGHAELSVSYELAKTVIARRADIHFMFALKPECFGDGTNMPAGVPGRITIARTEPAEFRRVLDASDYFLSFTIKRNAILAPPLTWFEAMGRGAPIVTLAAAGVDEVIASGDAGFVGIEPSDLLPWLEQAKRLPDEGLARCNARAREVGSVETSASHLCNLWDGLASPDSSS